MSTVQVAGNGFGGVVQGNWGTYQVASDGTFTVDTRDAPQMLVLGMMYLNKQVLSYAVPIAAPAAAVAGVVSSGALSNGTVSVTTQPTVMRPVNIEVGTGTTAITAGNIAVTYVGNDSQVTTDNFSAACALSSAVTQGTSKGVVSISSIVVTGLVGGTSPWIRASTTAALALPVGQGTTSFTVIREYDAGATVAIGTLSTALGCISPTTAPNGTVTYSFVYDYVATNS